MLIIYNIFFFLVNPFLKIFLIIRAVNKKEDFKRYKEKLGFASISAKPNLVWFHVASLGEIKSIHSIIKHYQKRKEINLLITSVTISSFEYFEKNLKNENTFHQYAPIDSPKIINRFLETWKPKLTVFVESEIWPNMIIYTSKKCKLILLNARISRNSFKKWKIIKSTFQNIMNKFDYILPQNYETQKKLEKLDLNKNKFIGNIKFTNLEKNLTNALSINNHQKSWAAMSIHFEEVDYIVQVHKNISYKYPNLKTFLIPRHINKIDKIINKINKYKLKYIRASKEHEINDFNGIIIIDKFGIAEDIFNKIKFVFMGGSFINHGGQNPLEPLKYNCKIYTGKNFNNFHEIYEELINKNIAKVVNNHSDLEKELILYFKNNNKVDFHLENSNYKEFSNKIFDKTIKFLDHYIN